MVTRSLCVFLIKIFLHVWANKSYVEASFYKWNIMLSILEIWHDLPIDFPYVKKHFNETVGVAEHTFELNEWNVTVSKTTVVLLFLEIFFETKYILFFSKVSLQSFVEG